MIYTLSYLSEKLIEHKAISQYLNHIEPVQASVLLDDRLKLENLMSTIVSLPISGLTEIGIVHLDTGDSFGEFTTVQPFTEKFVPEVNRLTCLCLCCYYGLVVRDAFDLEMLVSTSIQA